MGHRDDLDALGVENRTAFVASRYRRLSTRRKLIVCLPLRKADKAIRVQLPAIPGCSEALL